MELVVTPAPFVIGATGMEAVCQNIRVIVLTGAYSIPLDRGFAHDCAFIDSPAPKATARLGSALIEAIERFEPRVRVERIDFVTGADLMEGQLVPRIRFSLKDDRLTRGRV